MATVDAAAHGNGHGHGGAHGNGDDHGGGGGGEHIAHPVPLRILLGVYAALLVCTFLTVAVTKFEFGSFNVWVALGIAVIKSALVTLYFMHLRWDSPFNAIVLISALFFVSLFLGIAILDAKEYQVNLLPPGVQSAQP